MFLLNNPLRLLHFALFLYKYFHFFYYNFMIRKVKKYISINLLSLYGIYIFVSTIIFLIFAKFIIPKTEIFSGNLVNINFVKLYLLIKLHNILFYTCIFLLIFLIEILINKYILKNKFLINSPFILNSKVYNIFFTFGLIALFLLLIIPLIDFLTSHFDSIL